jgi:hypothetical protein
LNAKIRIKIQIFHSNFLETAIFIPSNSPKSCGGKFGAPSQPAGPNTLKINVESDKVPSPLEQQVKIASAPNIFYNWFQYRK